MIKTLAIMLFSALPVYAGGATVFTDPSFQNFTELAYGYKKPGRNNEPPAHQVPGAMPPGRAHAAPSDLRDAVGSASAGDAMRPVAELPAPTAGNAALFQQVVPLVNAVGPASVGDTKPHGVPLAKPPAPETGLTLPPDVPVGWPHMIYRVRSALRRGPISSPVPSPGPVPASSHRDLVFISFVPVPDDFGPLVSELSSASGFIYTGERALRYNPSTTAQIKVYGLVPSASLPSIYCHPAVARVGLERGRPELPLKSTVVFTLRVPAGVNPGEFIESFVASMSARAGFALAASVPAAGGRPGLDTFTPYSVSGEVHSDRVNELIGSPFVTTVSVKS
ncbi:MAG: hypothetical protein FD189_367 [Elusimicrobia bacterium]|nr:MAG: hypothetical protein FD154_447 [Elusimicrobiota bacterium]KAF0157846.1 MAG: hypothetical protein FD189_367 [Elusimicrobiota bacterium]